MVYKFRVILDNSEDIFRDIAIKSEDTLEDLHNAIINSFGFDGSEVGSFYTCTDEWEQEDEIPQFDMDETPGSKNSMSNFVLEDILHKDSTKIIYVYDFFNMWTFFVELAAMEDEELEDSYPATLFAMGNIPDSNDFEITDSLDANEDDDFYTSGYMDEDEEDDFGNYDDYENEDLWN
ncbi:MAG: hypothetical protein H6584_00130 [Flavobacteriales bacterium]|nr:hypothetical protein [Flavobacteriales bacterium]